MRGGKQKIDVYLEVGPKRAFAGAMDWPGWCRSGRDEPAALEALVAYGPRYGRVLARSRLGFRAPASASDLAVVERLKGGASTDFGAPEAHPAADSLPLKTADLKRQAAVLKACWQAFDDAVEAARGKRLRVGPRGGGRDLARMVRHVIEADGAYLSSLGWKVASAKGSARIEQVRRAILDGMAASARGEIPPRGPRGGVRWPARYFVRRVAWHVLDHTWELEDRIP